MQGVEDKADVIQKNCVGLRHSFSSRASFSVNFTTRFAAITICLEINFRGYMPGNEGTLLFPHARAYSHTVSYEERDERKFPLFLSIWTPTTPNQAPAIHQSKWTVPNDLQDVLQKRRPCKPPPKDRLQMIKQSKFILRRHSVQWIVRQEPREDRSCLCHQSFCLCRVVASLPYDLGEVELCSCYRCFRPEPLVCSFFHLSKSCSQVHSIRYQFRFLPNMWGKGIVLTLLHPTSSVVHTMHQQHSSSAG